MFFTSGKNIFLFQGSKICFPNTCFQRVQQTGKHLPFSLARLSLDHVGGHAEIGAKATKLFKIMIENVLSRSQKPLARDRVPPFCSPAYEITSGISVTLDVRGFVHCM